MGEDAILKLVGLSGVFGLISMAGKSIYRHYKEDYKTPHSVVYRGPEVEVRQDSKGEEETTTEAG